jgi:hypothetical protein
MKNKTLAIIGIGSYILSVITSAEDLEGNFVSPIVLIVISGIVTILFTVMATTRLWQGARHGSIMLASSTIIVFALTVIHEVALPKYGSPIIILLNISKIIHFLIFIYAIALLWAMAKYKSHINDLLRKSVKDLGLTPEEGSLIQGDLRKGDQESAVQRITTAQERERTKFKEATGIDPFAMIPVVGQDIKWTDIVRQVFRVLEFDRADTAVLADGTVKAATRTEPYGYLLVESPILNVKARLPITHSADFALATRVYDDPRLAEVIEETEFLVTYFPKHKLPMGLAGITHALHYVIVPRGTLERYYEFNNDDHMANPAPEKLFKEFVWHGEIRVQVNSDPKF